MGAETGKRLYTTDGLCSTVSPGERRKRKELAYRLNHYRKNR